MLFNTYKFVFVTYKWHYRCKAELSLQNVMFSSVSTVSTFDISCILLPSTDIIQGQITHFTIHEHVYLSGSPLSRLSINMSHPFVSLSLIRSVLSCFMASTALPLILHTHKLTHANWW